MSCAHAFGEWCPECIAGVVTELNAAKVEIARLTAELTAVKTGYHEEVTRLTAQNQNQFDTLTRLSNDSAKEIARLREQYEAALAEATIAGREIVRLRAALVAQAWQPMATLPDVYWRGGREVLLLVKQRAGVPYCMVVGHYLPGGHCIEDHPPIDAGWYFWNGCLFDRACEPLMWTALPEKPA